MSLDHDFMFKNAVNFLLVLPRMSDIAKRCETRKAILVCTLCLLSLIDNSKLYSPDKDSLTTAAAFVVRESY